MTDLKAQAEHGASVSDLAADFSRWNDFSSAIMGEKKQILLENYGFLKSINIGKSVSGTPIDALYLGSGKRRLLISASHHGNEWITSPVLLQFIQELCRSYSENAEFFGLDCRTLLKSCRFCFVPLVNPDGVDIAAGKLSTGSNYDKVLKIAAEYPQIAFPEGWKANIRGVDLNLQYPAGWEKAKALKYAAGFTSPAPRDFVGFYPLSEPESTALYDLTLSFSPHAVVALHTQGQEIYWQYGGEAPRDAKALGKRMAAVSGYTLAETPAFSDNAGYKDWFISHYQRPGFTIELGLGTSPLPLNQLDSIYNSCAQMLLEAALG